MAARLNNTSAITGKGYDAGEHHSYSYRKIDNGYVVEECTSNYGTGDYKSKSTFVKEKPEFPALKLGKGDNADLAGASQNALADTKSYLRGK